MLTDNVHLMGRSSSIACFVYSCLCGESLSSPIPVPPEAIFSNEHDFYFVTESSKSKKEGKEVPTHSRSITVTPSLDARPATAADMAAR